VGYVKSYENNKKITPKRAWLWSRDLFKLLVPSYNISRTAKARDFKFCTVVCQVVV